MGLVQDKICLVTGGASNPGLGHAIAHKFAAEGARVIVTDMDKAGVLREQRKRLLRPAERPYRGVKM